MKQLFYLKHDNKYLSCINIYGKLERIADTVFKKLAIAYDERELHPAIDFFWLQGIEPTIEEPNRLSSLQGRMKPVLVYDADTLQLIKECRSINEAAQLTGIRKWNIQKAVDKQVQQYGRTAENLNKKVLFK